MRFPRPFLPCAALLIALATACTALAQTFANPKVISTGNWPTAVYSGDFDGDGNRDLLYLQRIPGTPAGQNDTLVKILYGDGSGNFSAPIQQGTLNSAVSLVVNVADVNGDGVTDLFYAQAATSGPSTYGVWFGDRSRAMQMPSAYTQRWAGSNSFTQIVGFPMNTYINSDPTLIVLNSTGSGTVFTYTLGALRPIFGFALPDGAGPAVATDVNGDGIPDIVVLGQRAGTVDVFLTSPFLDPFSAPLRFSVAGIHSFLVRDVNLDGRPDLIAEGANGHIDVYFGNGDGTFQATSSGGTGPVDGITGNGGQLIATGDFNHDGQLDALTATPIGVSTLLGQGTQYLGLKGIYNAGPAVDLPNTTYAVADFNGDGNQDLALPSPEGIAILYGNPDGSFQTNQAFAAGAPAQSGMIGPFRTTKGYMGDNDITGNVDAMVGIGAAQAQLLYGNGDGTYQFKSQAGNPLVPAPTVSTPSAPGLIGTPYYVDWNQDGNPDIAIAADGPPSAIPANGSGVVIQLGDGTGNFAAPLYLGGLNETPCLQPRPVLFGQAAPGGGGSVYESGYDLAYHLYTRSMQAIEAFNAQSYRPYELGSDGPCDADSHDIIAAGLLLYTDSDDALFQQGSHMYVLLSAYTNSWNVSASGDLSVDGSATTPGQLVAPQLSSTFGGVSPTLGFPAFPGSAVITDLDGDGLNDIIVAYDNMGADHTAPTAANPNYLYIWFNSGNGKFLTSAKHPVNPVRITPSRNFYQVVVKDVNGDKIPDLVLSDGYVVSVQLGKGDGTFGSETHYLAGQGLNTISVGDVDQNGTADLVIANGGAVFGNPVANKDVIGTNADVNTGGITVLLNPSVTLLVPAYNLTASPEPSAYGTTFTITASFPPPSGGTTAPTPTGNVTFYVDGVLLGSASIDASGNAMIAYAAPNTLSVGVHTLTGSYSGDTTYRPTSLTGTHTVTGTIYGVMAYPEPSTYGSSFVLTGTAPGPGRFAFLVDGTPVGSATSSSNTASVTVPGTFTVGTHTLTLAWTATASALAVIFTGTHQIIQNTTTLSLLLCVDPPGTNFPCGSPNLSSTPLISPITFFFGQSLDGVAIESATNLTGNIVFYNNTNVFCTIPANLSSGANMCPTQSGFFNSGTYTVYATYTGDANNTASKSNSIQVIVYADPTTASLTTSANPAVVGTNVTFTYPITGNFATPNGAVNFYDGIPSTATLIGSATLDATGTATFSTANLAVGTHTIYAVYSGNSNFAGIQSSISQVITPVAVSPPPPTGNGYTLTITPDPITVGAGATGILRVAVTGQSGQTPPVTLNCSGLPDEATCIFVTPTLPAGGGVTTLQLHVTAPHDCGSSTPYFIGSESGPASSVPYTLAAVFFGSVALYRRRRLSLKGKASMLLLILIALASLASLSGCGHCTDLGTRPGNYSFTVTATPSGTSTSGSESVTIPLTVTIP